MHADQTATIAIVNYNAGPLLAECLRALLLQDRQDFVVYVVDNASDDDSLEHLPQDPRFHIIRNEHNVGFAAANNQILLEADTPWVIALNPDTRPTLNWFSSLMRVAEKEPDAGMFGSSQLMAKRPEVADGFGDELFCSGISWRIGHGASTPKQLPGGEVFGPCAAAAMYRTDLFKRAGGFCERFFCYAEDIDLAFRLRLLGTPCVQVASAVVFHHGYASAGSRSDFMLYHATRNLVWFYHRCWPWPLLFITYPLHLGMLMAIFAWSFKQKKQRVVGKAIIHGLKALPTCVKERRQIHKHKIVGMLDIAKAMTWNPAKVRNWRRRVKER